MTNFQFHAQSPTQRKSTQFLHFCFYLGALLLTVAGIYSLYRYFTAWTAPGDTGHWWDLALGIVYLVVSALVVYATYHHGNTGHEPQADRYAEIKNGTLTYELDQVSGKQTVMLDQIAKTERPSVREMIITLRDGTQRVVPIYLIDDDGKREELERLLVAAGN